jgi:hypothetical protein
MSKRIRTLHQLASVGSALEWVYSLSLSLFRQNCNATVAGRGCMILIRRLFRCAGVRPMLGQMLF